MSKLLVMPPEMTLTATSAGASAAQPGSSCMHTARAASGSASPRTGSVTSACGGDGTAADAAMAQPRSGASARRGERGRGNGT